MDNQVAALKSVFGTFSHEQPKPPVVLDRVKAARVYPEDQDALPEQTEFSPITGLVLTPSHRFDGDSDISPWNAPEPSIFNALKTVDVDLLEDRVLDGTSGAFWGRVRYPDQSDVMTVPIKSVLVKFGGPTQRFVSQAWGPEYMLGDKLSELPNRALAAYEIAKVCGCEDIVPPIIGKDLNPIKLLSDKAREKISGRLRISPDRVDEALGIAATVQIYPKDSDNFVEYWCSLGATSDDRWNASSDRLRHSIYRAFILDFLVGVQDRCLASLLYNKITDRVVVQDLSLSFPHPGFSAEKYIAERRSGWKREVRSGLRNTTETWPAHSQDLSRLIGNMPFEYRKELLMTVRQVCDLLTPDALAHATVVLQSFGIPLQCCIGTLLKACYLALNNEDFLDKPMDFVRNILVPIRRGMAQDNIRVSGVVSGANEIASLALGQEMNVSDVVQEEAPSSFVL